MAESSPTQGFLLEEWKEARSSIRRFAELRESTSERAIDFLQYLDMLEKPSQSLNRQLRGVRLVC